MWIWHKKRKIIPVVFLVLVVVSLWINIQLAINSGDPNLSSSAAADFVRNDRLPSRQGGYLREISKFQTAKECYFELERKKNSWIGSWLADEVPILDAVLSIHSEVAKGAAYQVSVIVKHLVKTKEYWDNAIWYCNRPDNPGRTLVTKTPVHLIECVFPDPNETLHTIWPSKTSPKVNATVKYTSLQEFVDCDGLELREATSALAQTSADNTPLLGACAIVHGVGPNIPPWIEYHKLLGYDHFWIFVNEPFPQEEWIQRPYITYIPYGFVWDNHKHHATSYYRKPKFDAFWQTAMQMKCLYHAKRLGNVQWLTTTDVDEYIWVNATKYSDQSSPLKAFLLDHRNEYDHLAGLALNSVFFGRHAKKETTFDSVNNGTRWLMDYIYRNSKSKWQREKVIYQPANVKVAEIHTAKGGATLRIRHDVYFQHYKKASQGIAKTTGKDVLVRDSRLRDQYMERVREALQVGEHLNMTPIL